ncbi:MAG: hypothetical protein AAGA48_34365 [Myxococcota bacterium]
MDAVQQGRRALAWVKAALERGEERDARQMIDAARAAVLRSADPWLIRRLEVQAAIAALCAGDDPRETLAQAIEEAEGEERTELGLWMAHARLAVGDPIGASAELARLPPFERADLAQHRQALGALLGSELPPAQMQTRLLEPLGLAAAVAHEGTSGAAHDATLRPWPMGHRRLAGVWIQHARRRVGIKVLRSGPSPAWVLHGPHRVLRRDGQPCTDFGRSQLLFRLLSTIAATPDLAPEALYERVWGLKWLDTSANTLHVAITRLRARLAEGGPQLERGPHGGYVLAGAHAMVAYHPSPKATGSGLQMPTERRFIGRYHLRRRLREALHAGVRLVTLTGPGGVGKSRLAVEVFREPDDRWPDGAHFVDLTRSEPVLNLVAQALGVNDPGGSEAFAKRVAMRGPTLVVLDNAEHVLASVQALVEVLLAAQPANALQFVVTSRWRLEVEEEHAIEVPPLDRVEAIDLFIDRAQTSRSNVDLEEPRDAMGTIVDAVDRLPLAIELVAARAALLTLPELVQHTTTVLQLRRRDPSPERHATMDAALQWSWDLLGQEERSVMAQVSVFRGGFTEDAAQAIVEVAQETWLGDVLDALVAYAWLQHVDDRYTFFQTILDFAARQRGDDAALIQRHAEYFVRRGKSLEAGDSQWVANQWRWAERANLLAIAERLHARPPEPSAAHAAMLLLSGRRAIPNTQDRLAMAHAIVDSGLGGEPACRARMALGQSMLELGEVDAGLSYMREAIEHASRLGHRELHGQNLSVLGYTLLLYKPPEDARPILQQAEDLLEGVTAPYSHALLKAFVAHEHKRCGRLEAAMEAYHQSLEQFRAVDARESEGLFATNASSVFYEAGRLDEAVALADRALLLFRQIGLRHHESVMMMKLAIYRNRQGYSDEAIRIARRGVAIREQTGDLAGLRSCRASLGSLLVSHARYSQARELLSTVIQDPQTPPDSRGLAHLSLAQMHLDEGNPESAFGEMDRAKGCFERVGHRAFRLHERQLRGVGQLLAGQEALGAATLEETLDEWVKGLDRALRDRGAVYLWSVRAWDGAYDEVAQRLERIERRSTEASQRWETAFLQMARCHLEAARAPRRADRMVKALEELEALGRSAKMVTLRIASQVFRALIERRCVAE